MEGNITPTEVTGAQTLVSVHPGQTLACPIADDYAQDFWRRLSLELLPPEWSVSLIRGDSAAGYAWPQIWIEGKHIDQPIVVIVRSHPEVGKEKLCRGQSYEVLAAETVDEALRDTIARVADRALNTGFDALESTKLFIMRPPYPVWFVREECSPLPQVASAGRRKDIPNGDHVLVDVCAGQTLSCPSADSQAKKFWDELTVELTPPEWTVSLGRSVPESGIVWPEIRIDGKHMRKPVTLVLKEKPCNRLGVPRYQVVGDGKPTKSLRSIISRSGKATGIWPLEADSPNSRPPYPAWFISEYCRPR